MNAKLDIYLPDLAGGGAEKLHVQLAAQFHAAGFRHRFVLNQLRGELVEQVPSTSSIIALQARRQVSALSKLAALLRHDPPDILIVNQEHQLVTAALACRMTRAQTKLMYVQHNCLTLQLRRSFKYRVLPPALRRAFRTCDAVVGVSRGVTCEVADFATLDPAKARTIYNGVVKQREIGRSYLTPEHPFFTEHSPVLIAAGRLSREKGFRTLVDAFSIAQRSTAARLIILGEGPERAELQSQIRQLELSDFADLAGFVDEPQAYFASSAMLVCSSWWEGFGNVLVEALACGTPVVSTDCPHGPAEILEEGRYGRLVARDDPQALASAILGQLQTSANRKELQARAAQFTVERCAREYVDLCENLLRTESRPQN